MHALNTERLHSSALLPQTWNDVLDVLTLSKCPMSKVRSSGPFIIPLALPAPETSVVPKTQTTILEERLRGFEVSFKRAEDRTSIIEKRMGGLEQEVSFLKGRIINAERLSEGQIKGVQGNVEKLLSREEAFKGLEGRLKKMEEGEDGYLKKMDDVLAGLAEQEKKLKKTAEERQTFFDGIEKRFKDVEGGLKGVEGGLKGVEGRVAGLGKRGRGEEEEEEGTSSSTLFPPAKQRTLTKLRMQYKTLSKKGAKALAQFLDNYLIGMCEDTTDGYLNVLRYYETHRPNIDVDVELESAYHKEKTGASLFGLHTPAFRQFMHARIAEASMGEGRLFRTSSYDWVSRQYERDVLKYSDVEDATT